MVDYSKCRDEQQFKMMYIKEKLKPAYPEVFCIETEETVKGFPDVMCLTANGRAYFCEFKFSSPSGKIKFQPSQPAFYRLHKGMNIWVIAYNQKTKKVVEFPVWDMGSVKGAQRFYMNEKAEVQL